MRRNDKIDEATAVNSVINLLTEHNIRKEEYQLQYCENGKFIITFCPRRHVVLDIMYLLERIPDVKVLKIKHDRDIMTLVIKIKIRDD